MNVVWPRWHCDDQVFKRFFVVFFLPLFLPYFLLWVRVVFLCVCMCVRDGRTCSKRPSWKTLSCAFSVHQLSFRVLAVLTSSCQIISAASDNLPNLAFVSRKRANTSFSRMNSSPLFHFPLCLQCSAPQQLGAAPVFFFWLNACWSSPSTSQLGPSEHYLTNQTYLRKEKEDSTQWLQCQGNSTELLQLNYGRLWNFPFQPATSCWDFSKRTQ